MVRNAISMQNIRSNTADLHLSSSQQSFGTLSSDGLEPTNQNQEQPPQLQTLGSRHSVQLRGKDAHTKALMNRIATGSGTTADYDEFYGKVQATQSRDTPDGISYSQPLGMSFADAGVAPDSKFPVQDYQMNVMLLEQENKRRLLKESREAQGYNERLKEARQARESASDNLSKPQTPEAQARPAAMAAESGQHALNDYQMQLFLLEEQNRKRRALMPQDQESTSNTQKSSEEQKTVSSGPPANQPCWQEPAPKAPPSVKAIANQQARPGPMSLQECQTQLMLLEQQNKKRLQMARQEQDAMAGTQMPGRYPPASSHPGLQKSPQLSEDEIYALRFPQATKGAAEVYCEPFCDFLTDNPTVFHAVDFTKKQLKSTGWTEISERDAWDIKPSGRYFVERNGSSLIAFVVGASYEPGNGAAILAGHVDALTAKLKPVSEVPNKAGYLQLGVAPYAGAMSETWWDRDLGIGGRVLVEKGGKIKSKLVNLNWPIARIPTLAPHFGAAAQGPFNKETQMTPIIGLEVDDDSQSPIFIGSADATFVSKQPPALVRAIGKELGLNEQTYSKIVNWELELFDIQPATVGGLNKEFIYGGRIDDKLCSWAAMQALTGSSTNDTSYSSVIKVVAWFDNEEIGSQLRQGARSNFLPQVLERAVGSLSRHQPSSDLMGRTYANSFLLSSDVTHAVNPNFLNAYLGSHMPKLNTGLTIAADANGHMTTDAVSTAILQRCAEKVGAKLQVFQIRNDSRSGGTVGPMLSSMTGIRAIDAGMPQLSMHSIRATTGSLDPGLGVIMFTGFLNGFEHVDKEFRS